jgi:hypothetical protein
MNREVIAYHEAGHAVADWKHGFKLKRVTIVPRGDTAGSVTSTSRLHFRSLEYSNPTGARIGRCHERIVCWLAGRASQRRYKPQSVRTYQASSDMKVITELLTHLHADNELKFVFGYLETRARNFVSHPQHWRMIQDLAKVLLARRTMTGAEVEATLKESMASQLTEMKGARTSL